MLTTTAYCPALAQANVNLEKLSRANNTPKFIEGIEIQPAVLKQSHTDFLSTAPVVKTTSSIVTNNVNTTIEKCIALQFKFAMLTHQEVELINNINLYTQIDEWWGTPYRYGGSTKNGIDCSAFCCELIQKQYNITLPRTAKEQYQQTEKINAADLQEGDLVFFNTRGGVSHVGFYLANKYFVHSSTNSGVTISSLDDAYYKKKFIGAARIKK